LEGNPVREYEGHTAAVNSLSMANNDEFVSGSWDGTAIVWNIATGEQKQVLKGHTHATAVLTLPNGLVITGS
jgi:WD40 repeat protein